MVDGLREQQPLPDDYNKIEDKVAANFGKNIVFAIRDLWAELVQKVNPAITIINNTTIGSAVIGVDFNRPRFKYKDGDEIYIGPGSYVHKGSTTQILYWDSELTFAFGSGGSNSDSNNLATDDFFYLYIDDSAVIAGASNILTASEFVALTTEPVWSDSKQGWYSSGDSNDRCLTALLTDDASAVLRQFWHDGGNQHYYDRGYSDIVARQYGTTFTDASLTIPAFATRANSRVTVEYNGANATAYYRPNGQTFNNAHVIGRVTNNGYRQDFYATMFTDSNQVIELRSTVDASKPIMSIYPHGWVYPRGM